MRAILILNVIHTILVSIVLTRADVPYWGLLIPVVFIIGFLPGIGGVLSMLLASLMGFLVSPTTVLIILGILSVYRLIEELWIQPHIMHATTQLPLALSYLVPLIGGLIAGPVGALLAIPVVLVFIALAQPRQASRNRAG